MLLGDSLTGVSPTRCLPAQHRWLITADFESQSMSDKPLDGGMNRD
jgi:hypothetical protein